MELGLWQAWWKRTGARGVRELLLFEWDPIGVGASVRRGEWVADEYDAYVGQVGRLLREGATKQDIAVYLESVEREQMGLVGDIESALPVAEQLLAWYEREMPANRAGAVEVARREAQRIVAGDYDDEPFGVFQAAQRIEHLLTAFDWTDTEFPPPIADFVFGWNVSGPETSDAIRTAARELAEDKSPPGPAHPPRSAQH